MKKRISSLLFASLLVASCSEAQHSTNSTESTTPSSTGNSTTTTAQTAAKTRVVSATEFKSLTEKEGYQLLDVRTPDEYNAGKIGNAVNINFFDADFAAQVDKLDKSKPVLIYCASGNRSGKATAIMKNMGFTEIIDLQGGYGNWPFK